MPPSVFESSLGQRLTLIEKFHVQLRIQHSDVNLEDIMSQCINGVIVVCCIILKEPSFSIINKFLVEPEEVRLLQDAFDITSLPFETKNLLTTMWLTGSVDWVAIAMSALKHFKPSTEEEQEAAETARFWIKASNPGFVQSNLHNAIS